MDSWALQTSRLNPNPCPLPWVSDYKVIPPSLSCSNWISLRDLWKLTSANAALLPPKNSSQSFQNTNHSAIKTSVRKARTVAFVFLVAGLKPASPVAARSWRRRLSPRRRLPTGEACLPGQPGCQVASLPAGWARSNQGCGDQLELPTSAPLALGWLKAKALLSTHMRGVTLRSDQTLHMKKVNGMNGDQRNPSAPKDISTMASVSDIKWTVHSLSINIAVVPLSTPHHCCHLFTSFASATA